MSLNIGPRGIFTPRNAKMELLQTREAWSVTFEGFEEFSFRLYKMDGLWAIAELQTGLPVTRGHGTKQEAYDKATYLLGIQGAEKTRKAIMYQCGRINDHGVVAVTA